MKARPRLNLLIRRRASYTSSRAPKAGVTGTMIMAQTSKATIMSNARARFPRLRAKKTNRCGTISNAAGWRVFQSLFTMWADENGLAMHERKACRSQVWNDTRLYFRGLVTGLAAHAKRRVSARAEAFALLASKDGEKIKDIISKSYEVVKAAGEMVGAPIELEDEAPRTRETTESVETVIQPAQGGYAAANQRGAEVGIGAQGQQPDNRLSTAIPDLSRPTGGSLARMSTISTLTTFDSVTSDSIFGPGWLGFRWHQFEYESTGDAGIQEGYHSMNCG